MYAGLVCDDELTIYLRKLGRTTSPRQNCGKVWLGRPIQLDLFSLDEMTALLSALAKFSKYQSDKAALNFLDDLGCVNASLSYEELK